MNATQIAIEAVPAVRAWRHAQSVVAQAAEVLRRVGHPRHYQPAYAQAHEHAVAIERRAAEKAATFLAENAGPWGAPADGLNPEEREWMTFWTRKGADRVAMFERFAGVAMTEQGRRELMEGDW